MFKTISCLCKKGISVKNIVIVTATIALLSLTSCAPLVWDKSGASPADFNTDKFACQQSSMTAAPAITVNTNCTFFTNQCQVQDFNQGNRNSLFNNCMQAHGWSLIRQPKTAQNVPTHKEGVSEEQIKARYDYLVSVFKPQDEVHARHILVNTEEEAANIIQQLKRGADFSALAAKNSKDAGSAKQGGDLGFFIHDAMAKSFADEAFVMKVGEISDVPVKTEFGYHIIKIEGKRKSAPPPLSEVHDKIADQLR
jgi:hypothetical protein